MWQLRSSVKLRLRVQLRVRVKLRLRVKSNETQSKRPPNAYECGHNITDPIECDSLGGCFDRGIAPNCYYPECQNPNPCLNGGKCIAIGKPNLPFTCICADGWAGSQCQYKNIGRCIQIRPEFTKNFSGNMWAEFLYRDIWIVFTTISAQWNHEFKSKTTKFWARFIWTKIWKKLWSPGSTSWNTQNAFYSFVIIGWHFQRTFRTYTESRDESIG